MKQSHSSEPKSHSGSQENPRLLCNPEAHYHVHNSPPTAHILSQIHAIHIYPPSFPKIHSNIISPPIPASSEWSLPLRFSDQNFVSIFHLSQACYLLHMCHSRRRLLTPSIVIQSVTLRQQLRFSNVEWRWLWSGYKHGKMHVGEPSSHGVDGYNKVVPIFQTSFVTNNN